MVDFHQLLFIIEKKIVKCIASSSLRVSRSFVSKNADQADSERQPNQPLPT